ncbi:MAG: hypothetical protein JSW65_05740 [Candidatus Bipolaricaulota bacterium]|nr:MAG: hypothetical protein JSW65_05740 [Candidatus Bipolaricaulota bacterium]
MKTRKTAAIAAMFLLGGCAVLAPPIEVAGTWIGDLAWVAGDPLAGFEEPLSLILEQTGSEVTGSVILQGPSATSLTVPVETGNAGRRSMDLRAAGPVTVGSQVVSITVTLVGELEEGLLTGTGTRIVNGDAHDFEWSARRTAPPATP